MLFMICCLGYDVGYLVGDVVVEADGTVVEVANKGAEEGFAIALAVAVEDMCPNITLT